MSNLKSLSARVSHFITGDEKAILENRIFSTATFALSVLSISIAFISFAVTGNFLPNTPLILAAVLFSLFFFNSRFKERFRRTSLIFLFFNLLFCDYVWFYGITLSPAVDLIFPLILILGLTILPVKGHFIYIVISICNILAVDLAAQLKPYWIYSWTSEKTFYSHTEHHSFLIIFMLFMAIVLTYFKRNYEKERMRSLERNRHLLNANMALKHRNEHLESLARMVSHNLRSPMAGMKMLLELYERMETQEEKDDILVNLKEGAFQLFNMVEDLSSIMLDYTELNKEKEHIKLSNIARSVTAQLKGLIKAENVQVNTDFEDYPEVIYSRTYLESIFLNLISNAIKYSSPDRPPVINIRSYREGDKIMLLFEDNGLGIDLERHREQLFKMYKTFHRIEGKDSKGIGLFITKNQVEMMGGKINVKSEVDKGTSFFIELYRV